MTLPNRYKLAELSLDSEGTYWIHWTGTHGNTGGLDWGSLGFTNVASALGHLSKEIQEHEKIYSERIKKRETEDDISMERQEDRNTGGSGTEDGRQ